LPLEMIICIKLVYLSSEISLKLQLIGHLHCHLSEITELKYTSLIKIGLGRMATSKCITVHLLLQLQLTFLVVVVHLLDGPHRS